jgi:hypothetical protein
MSDEPKTKVTAFQLDQLAAPLLLLVGGLVFSALGNAMTVAPNANWTIWAFFWIGPPAAFLIGAVWIVMVALKRRRQS